MSVVRKTEASEIERYLKECWSTMKWKKIRDAPAPKGDGRQYKFSTKEGLSLSLVREAKSRYEDVWKGSVMFNDIYMKLGAAHEKADWETAAHLALTRSMSKLERFLDRGMGTYKKMLQSTDVL